MAKIKPSVGLILCVLFVFGVSGSTAREGSAPGKLVVLFTHDLHSYFLPRPLPSSTNPSETAGGYAKLATLIREQRTRHGGASVLVDAGDFSMGTLFHTSCLTDAFELRLMGAMGFDATTFGNHEFDFHPDGLAKTLQVAKKKAARLPAVVASNLQFGTPGGKDQSLRQAASDLPIQDYLILERNGMRIGIFGILGKDAQTDTPFAAPLTFAEPIAKSKAMVDILKNKEKADIIICLSHSGTSSTKTLSEDETLAREVPQIDIIISGHTHTVLPQPIIVGRTIVASSGCYGTYLGVLEIGFSKGQGVKLVSYDLPKVTGNTPEDPQISRDISRFKATLDRGYLAPYGLTYDRTVAEIGYDMAAPSHTYARPGEIGLGNMITDAYRYAVKKAEGPRHDHLHMVLQPLGHIRSSIMKGKITAADVFCVLSLGLGTDGTPGYPLLSVYVTGAELKKILEVETTVAKIKKNAHLQLSGVKCRYNPYRIPFDRVTAVLVLEQDGSYKPLEPQRLYRIGMNLYTAKMVDYVSRVSHGLLTIIPKDKNGTPIKDLKEAVIPAGAFSADPRIREIKEWAALSAYLKNFPDPDGNGIPNIPDHYRIPEGRLIAEPSWNPVNLVAGGTAITYGAIAVILLLALIVVITLYLLIRIVRRKRAS